MKTITRKEATTLLYEVGHQSNVTVKTFDEHGDEKKGIVLNNGMVYNPVNNTQLGMSNNQDNAERALVEILKVGNEFSIYSSYFNYATGDYEIK